MMSNDEELDVNHTPVELSEEELDGISGGISIFLSGSTFEKRDIFSTHRRSSRRRGRGSSSTFGTSQTFSSAFQFIGLGFNSAEDVMKVLSGLARLFGR